MEFQGEAEFNPPWVIKINLCAHWISTCAYIVLKTSFVVKVISRFFLRKLQGTRGRSSRCSQMLHDCVKLSEVFMWRKQDIRLPSMNDLVVSIYSRRDTSSAAASSSVTSALILPALWTSVGWDTSRGLSLSIISVPKALDFTCYSFHSFTHSLISNFNKTTSWKIKLHLHMQKILFFFLLDKLGAAKFRKAEVQPGLCERLWDEKKCNIIIITL